MSRLLLHNLGEVLAALKLPPVEAEKELLKELAVALYQRGIHTGKGAAARAYEPVGF